MTSAHQSKLHPYVLAMFTAVLSAVLSVTGFYFTSKIQAAAAIEQKRFEYRSEAYNAFIKSVDAKNSPTIAQLLNLGKIAEHMATDSEIQKFEGRLAELSKENAAWRENLTNRCSGRLTSRYGYELSLKASVRRDRETNHEVIYEGTSLMHRQLKALSAYR